MTSLKGGELVIYLDESGSPDVISTTGDDLLALGRTPNHLVIAALRCPDPNAVARAMQSCIAWANALPTRTRPVGTVTHLHAARDDLAVREHVCRTLATLPVKATAIVMDKRKLDPTREWYGDRAAFYNEMAGLLLSDSLHLYKRTRIVFSRKNFETTKDLQTLVAAVEAKWNEYVKRVGPAMPDQITARHETASRNVGLQAVDYVAWSLFRAFESGDLTYYRYLQPIVRHVFDLGNLTHYSAKRPM